MSDPYEYDDTVCTQQAVSFLMPSPPTLCRTVSLAGSGRTIALDFTEYDVSA